MYLSRLKKIGGVPNRSSFFVITCVIPSELINRSVAGETSTYWRKDQKKQEKSSQEHSAFIWKFLLLLFVLFSHLLWRSTINWLQDALTLNTNVADFRIHLYGALECFPIKVTTSFWVIQFCQHDIKNIFWNFVRFYFVWNCRQFKFFQIIF